VARKSAAKLSFKKRVPRTTEKFGASRPTELTSLSSAAKLLTALNIVPWEHNGLLKRI
jgi:hypothetical protein